MKKSDFIKEMQKTQAPLKGMVEMVPDDKLDWAPSEGFMTVGQVLKHLSDNWSVIRMMVTGDFPFSGPEAMEEAMKLENLPSYSKAEAIEAMEKDLAGSIAYVENEIPEDDFFSKVITAPWGFEGEVWTAVLMAKDHQMSHKMQLHQYLKLLGCPVHTGTLWGM
jgi:uncharacterized damage-inducible protein DinB